jgi:hypothetical protein
MKSRASLFNGFLVLVMLALAAGCATSEERKRKKELSNIRVHVESDSQADQSSAISVIRSHPVRFNIDREPVLDEHNVMAAKVIDQLGGFMIDVQFDRQGSWILERTTVIHKGKHLAIHSYFGEERWLAAPLIPGRNSTGHLTFTPDCTREEAERMVRGLNNAVRKLQRKENWPFPGPIDK